MPATDNNKVVVSFKSTIMFHKLVFTARPVSNPIRAEIPPKFNPIQFDDGSGDGSDKGYPNSNIFESNPAIPSGNSIRVPTSALDQARYRGVCLYLNNVKSVCTPSNRNTKPGDKIELKPLAVTKVETVELRLPLKTAAEIAELQIYFNSQG